MQIQPDEDEITLEENAGCCGLSGIDDARRVAQKLNIPYYVMNFKKEFKEKVIDYFIAEYLCGHTPNPCIACNRYVKWESLLKRSLDIGADCIATGHYARIEQLSNGRYALRTSATSEKDQTGGFCEEKNLGSFGQKRKSQFENAFCTNKWLHQVIQNWLPDKLGEKNCVPIWQAPKPGHSLLW